MDTFEEFLRDRDAALRSLDKAKLVAYYHKYGESATAKRLMEAKDDAPFWAAVHRARLTLESFTEAEKEVSRRWLAEHNFEVRPF